MLPCAAVSKALKLPWYIWLTISIICGINKYKAIALRQIANAHIAIDMLDDLTSNFALAPTWPGWLRRRLALTLATMAQVNPHSPNSTPPINIDTGPAIFAMRNKVLQDLISLFSLFGAILSAKLNFSLNNRPLTCGFINEALRAVLRPYLWPP